MAKQTDNSILDTHLNKFIPSEWKWVPFCGTGIYLVSMVYRVFWVNRVYWVYWVQSASKL